MWGNMSSWKGNKENKRKCCMKMMSSKALPSPHRSRSIPGLKSTAATMKGFRGSDLAEGASLAVFPRIETSQVN